MLLGGSRQCRRGASDIAIAVLHSAEIDGAAGLKGRVAKLIEPARLQVSGDLRKIGGQTDKTAAGAPLISSLRTAAIDAAGIPRHSTMFAMSAKSGRRFQAGVATRSQPEF